jgi:hypothetical protein
MDAEANQHPVGYHGDLASVQPHHPERRFRPRNAVQSVAASITVVTSSGVDTSATQVVRAHMDIQTNASRFVTLEICCWRQDQHAAHAPAEILAEVLSVASQQVRGTGVESRLGNRPVLFRERCAGRQPR